MYQPKQKRVEIANPSYAGTNYELRHESSIEENKSPTNIKTNGNQKVQMPMKSSVESFSNMSVSNKKPLQQYQTKYEITGPAAFQNSIQFLEKFDTQNSIADLEGKKLKLTFNHFESKNEAIPMPQNGGRTPLAANGLSNQPNQNKKNDIYKVPLKILQSVAGLPNVSKAEILPTIGKMTLVNRQYANSQINPSKNNVIQKGENHKPQLKNQMPYIQDPSNIPQNQVLIDRYLREKELKLQMNNINMINASKTTPITPKVVNMKKTKQSGLISLQNTMYITMQMQNFSPVVNNNEKNIILEQYYNNSQQVQQQYINNKQIMQHPNYQNQQRISKQFLNKQPNRDAKQRNMKPFQTQNKIITKQIPNMQVQSQNQVNDKAQLMTMRNPIDSTPYMDSVNPNDPILTTSHSAIFQQDKQLSSRIDQEFNEASNIKIKLPYAQETIQKYQKIPLPKLRGSNAVSPMGEKLPTEQNRSQLKQRRASIVQDKQDFKTQFDTFRSIYQGENRQLPRSAESCSRSDIDINFKKDFDNLDSEEVSSPIDEHIQILKTQHLPDTNQYLDPKQIQDKQENEEKVKQLKQFIYMVDLFNQMEQESKNHMNYIPENNIQNQIDKKQQKYNEQLIKMHQNKQEIIRKPNNNNINQNMWKHFQNLLKKNSSNPYLQEALHKQSQSKLSQEDISTNFKVYIEDMQNTQQNGLIDKITADDDNKKHQNYQQKKQLNQLKHLMQNNSSFASLIDKNVIGEIKNQMPILQGSDSMQQRNNAQSKTLQKGNTFDPFSMPQNSVFYNQSGNFQVGNTQGTRQFDEQIKNQDTRQSPQLPQMKQSPNNQDMQNLSLATMQNFNRNQIIMQNKIQQSYPRPTDASNINMSGNPLGNYNNFGSNSTMQLKPGMSKYTPSQSKFIPVNSINLSQTKNVSPNMTFSQGLNSPISPSNTLPSMGQQVLHGHQVRQHQRSQYGQYDNPAPQKQENNQIPMQISSTLFIMDCQTFGILSNQKLLKIGPQSSIPGTSIPSSSSHQYSEAQLVNFVMNRAQTCSSTPFLELPKLSEESKRILNTIKAQQHLHMVHEIQKIDTLIIEMDYFDYKNQLLQQLFHQWGNKVLSNLVLQIEPPLEQQKESFQTIHEYIEMIRKHHDDSIKLGNMQHQQLFSQINDLSSANEGDPFDSFEMKKSFQSSRNHKPQELNNQNRGSQQLPPASLIQKIHRVESGKVEPRKAAELTEEVFANELQILFPNKFNKKANKVVNSSMSSANYQKLKRGPLEEEKKLKKKINFHVLVKHTKLYEALKFVDLQNKIENSRQMIKKDAEENSKGPLSMYQLSSEMSHQLNELSSYILTKDCSILRFALYCAQVGIVNSASQLLRQFFKNIIIVVKPGSKVLPDGSIHKALELPKVDIEKINRYLVQSNMRKQMQTAQQKTSLKFSEILTEKERGNSHIDISYNDRQQVKTNFNTRYDLKSERDVMKKNYSLKSFRSYKNFEDEEMTYINHFNSGLSNIKVEGPNEKTTIKIIHKPFTHLDNSRVQKCFKIYNEFVQIVLKNRAILVTNQDSNPSNEFLKSDINKIYKLAYHMGIKLPRRSSNSSLLGRSPLIEMLKNHRQINQIKEQMIRFVHRILNEENGMSNNFIQCVIMGSNFQNQDLESAKKKSVFQDISEQPMSNIGQFVTSNNTYFKYQVGIGNNHQLIKSLMRQRLWWHHIQRDKNLPKQAVMKLDFDEAQIMWSQWRKVKLYDFLQTHKQYKDENSELISIIDNGKLQMQQNENKILEKTSKERHNEKVVKLFVKQKSSKKSPDEDNYSDEFEEIPINGLKQKLEICKKQIQKIYNRLEFNQHLNNKKALFINMRNYYTYCCDEGSVFDTLPLTFNIKMGHDDPEFIRFQKYYEQEQIICKVNKNRKNIWIIKPGENSNRGNGIKVEQELSKIRSLVLSYCSGNGARTMILQKYIDNPLLYQRRKFDIRCFSLVTCHNGILKAYFYRDGYIRTSSKEYNHSNLNLGNKFIHLVNDAVQKYSEDYGKYEPGNKLSYQEFQKYLTLTYPDKNINMERDIIMQIKKIVADTIRATFHVIDSKKRMNSYELFGYDFMFDDEFKPFLIEVNSNPSLEPSSTMLNKIFTHMLDNTFRLGIDPLFPPQDGFSLKKGATGIDVCPENRFDLVFDERIDGPGLLKKFKNIGKKEKEEVDDINELSGSGDEQEEDDEAEAEVEDQPEEEDNN